MQTGNGGANYGQGGRVLVQKGEVVAKSANSISVKDPNGITITFKVTHATRFIITNFAFINLGDTAQVLGQDTGTQFVAQTVIVRHQGGHGHNNNDNNDNNGDNNDQND